MTPIELTFTEQAPLTLGFSQDDPIVLDVGEKQQAANYNEHFNLLDDNRPRGNDYGRDRRDHRR